MISLKKILILVCVLFLSGCNNPIVGYAQVKHPGCQVENIKSNSTHTILRISCPNQEPFEETFRSNK